MTNKTDQDALMIRYLLGTATDAEQVRLEEQFFADDQQYQQLQALEDELRYEYAQGGLSPDQRKSFEARFLKSAEDRHKVELAKSVLAKAYEVREETAEAASAPQQSADWWQSFTGFFAPQRFSFAGGAAALVILSAGSWLMLDRMQLRNQVDQLQARQKQVEQDAQKQIAAERQQQNQLSQELENQRARGKQQVEKSAPSFFGFVLAPGLVRDTDGMKRLVIPARAGDVLLQLDVKSKGAFKSYRAELQNLDGDVLWSRNVPDASLTLPGRLFAPGDYVVMLKGIRADGAAVDAGEFYFQVVRR